MTAYQWKLEGMYKVDAQTAGNELERIYRERGAIEPATVVDESRPDDAPLHCCFEWDDEKAAEKYRLAQARTMIACVVAVGEPEEGMHTRAFVHVESEYQPIGVVLKSVDKTNELLQSAYRDMRIFQSKYNELSELAQVLGAIDVALAA